MKMRLFQKFLIIVLIGFPGFTEAQNKHSSTNQIEGARFYGNIQGGEHGKDSLEIVYFDDVLLNTSESFNSSRKVFTVATDEVGNFSFQLPRINSFGKLGIMIRGDKVGRQWLIDSIHPYMYFENGDSIQLQIQILASSNVIGFFSGRGSHKYEMTENILQMMKLKFWASRLSENFYSNNEKYEINLGMVIERFNTLRDLINRVVTYYDGNVTPELLSLIKIDFLSILNLQYILELKRFYEGVQTIAKIGDFDRYLDVVSVSSDNLKNELYAISIYFCNYLIERNIFNFKVNNNGDGHGVRDIYELLKNNYSGLLREKLITAYLMNTSWRLGENSVLSTDDTYNYCLKDAYGFITHPSLKRIFSKKINKYAKGSPAYNFALPDTLGNIIELRDFQGKVVLVDIYSTVCTGCRIFAKTLKQKVFPEFKDNSNVVFIAISTETERGRWLQDLDEGKNASKKYEVNLYTDGMGMNHPYIKYYDIMAVPTIFLIDKKGEIYNSSSNNLKATSSGEEINAMIHEALNAVN